MRVLDERQLTARSSQDVRYREGTNLSWNDDSSGFDPMYGPAVRCRRTRSTNGYSDIPGFQIRGNSLRLNNGVGKGGKSGEIAWG